MNLVELGGFEPPSEITQPKGLHVYSSLYTYLVAIKLDKTQLQQEVILQQILSTSLLQASFKW